ncbi:hypothetical protein K8I61_16435 [bacterium]|nr:hypothetical protein [bacterium]
MKISAFVFGLLFLLTAGLPLGGCDCLTGDDDDDDDDDDDVSSLSECLEKCEEAVTRCNEECGDGITGELCEAACEELDEQCVEECNDQFGEETTD